jgi:hypothetical protein
LVLVIFVSSAQLISSNRLIQSRSDRRAKPKKKKQKTKVCGRASPQRESVVARGADSLARIGRSFRAPGRRGRLGCSDAQPRALLAREASARSPILHPRAESAPRPAQVAGPVCLIQKKNTKQPSHAPHGVQIRFDRPNFASIGCSPMRAWARRESGVERLDSSLGFVRLAPGRRSSGVQHPVLTQQALANCSKKKKTRKELIADQSLEDIATGSLRCDQCYRSDIALYCLPPSVVSAAPPTGAFFLP